MRKAAITAILVAASLTACGNKNDASEKNFSAALSEYFAKKGDLCLNARKWPVDITEMEQRISKAVPGGQVGQMTALEAVGLVAGADVEIDQIGYDGKPSGRKLKVRRYALTDAAKPYLRDVNVNSLSLSGATITKQSDLCWGKMALDKIVKWEGPMKFGDYQEANVFYTYKVDDVAPWAKRPEFQAVFGGAKAVLDGAGNKHSQHGVKLTSNGWEANGLD
jgi:hypothetical protein